MDKAAEFDEIASSSETPIEADPAPPVVDATDAVPVAKKRGRPPKKVTPTNPPTTDSKIEPTPVDQQALLNSLAELIKRNDANAYNAKLQLYKSFLPLVK